jgi:DNA-binding response OmpR family regulator
MPPLPLKHSYRIIVVEDDPDFAKMQSYLFQKSGHDVRCVSTASEALKLLESFTPDIMLIDIGLPGMDGCELARQLRANKAIPRFPLVAQSGHGLEEDKQRAISAGIDYYFKKPVDWKRLIELLDNLLSVDAGA